MRLLSLLIILFIANQISAQNLLKIKSKEKMMISVWVENPEAYGYFESICPSIVELKSSSHLKEDDGIYYKEENLSKLYTKEEKLQVSAWVEGNNGYGIGEKLRFTFKSLQPTWESWTFRGYFRFINGYAKNEMLWRANSRVKKMRVYRNDVPVATITIKDSWNIQQFDLSPLFEKEPFQVNETLTFEIIDVYKGEKYRDTAISWFVPTCNP